MRSNAPNPPSTCTPGSKPAVSATAQAQTIQETRKRRNITTMLAPWAAAVVTRGE
jgi:hypothetical protein